MNHHKNAEPEYTIVADVDNYKGCLVYACGVSYDRAKELLNRLINNPLDDEKKRFAGYTNYRIERVEPQDCWWNQGGLD